MKIIENAFPPKQCIITSHRDRRKKDWAIFRTVHGWGVNRTFGSFLWLLVGIFFPVMVTWTYIEASSCHVYWKVTTLLSGWARLMLNTSCHKSFLCSGKTGRRCIVTCSLTRFLVSHLISLQWTRKVPHSVNAFRMGKKTRGREGLTGEKPELDWNWERKTKQRQR